MRIAHLYPKYHANVGDHLVQRGILRLLRKHVGDFEYTPLATRKTGPDPAEPTGITAGTVELINRHDLVIIGGSNLYENNGDQWGVRVESEALKRLTAPVLPLGIGGGWSFAYPAFPVLPPAVVDDLRALHAKAVGSSVRDSLTERLLRSNGIGPCTLTGCPAMYLAEEPLRPVRKGVVGIPFLPQRMYSAPALNPLRWRNPTHQRRRSVARMFLDLLRRIPEAGYETRILVHDAADLPLARELVGSSGFFFSEEPERLFDAIAECDLIVGFRLHASITALGLGIPSIPILLDGRNDAFVETLGMTELAVPIDPASVSMVLERIAVAMGGGRDLWKPAIERRDALRAAMDGFLRPALARVPGAAEAAR